MPVDSEKNKLQNLLSRIFDILKILEIWKFWKFWVCFNIFFIFQKSTQISKLKKKQNIRTRGDSKECMY